MGLIRKCDAFFADVAKRRIDSEFWVDPTGRVVRLRVSDDPDWAVISSDELFFSEAGFVFCFLTGRSC